MTGGRAGFVARVRDAREPVRVFTVLGASVDEVTCQRDRMTRVYNVSVPEWGDARSVSCHTTTFAFECTSKRRKGFPSEQRVKKGKRVVHGDKDLIREAGP